MDPRGFATVDYGVDSYRDEQLKQIGTPAVESLTAALKDEYWRVRSFAADVIGSIGDKRAVESLILALKDESDKVIRVAARGLAKIGDLRAVKPLIDALRHHREIYFYAVDIKKGTAGQTSEIILKAHKQITNENFGIIIICGRRGGRKTKIN